MKRLFGFAALLSLLGVAALVVAADKDKDEPKNAKEALQAFNEFVGSWKGDGQPDKPNAPAKENWKESMTWTWRFKGDDAWLALEIKDGKLYKGGELRYLMDKKKYEFTLIDKDDKKLVFEGELKDGNLKLERQDPTTKDTQQLTMNTAAEGIRFNTYVAHKPDGKTIVTKDYKVAYNKDGESLGAKEKMIECVVSGGLGKIPVQYDGVTYYVCCSGCKDAFMDNPKKYVEEFKAKKNKKP
jgi:hypothetical protein